MTLPNRRSLTLVLLRALLLCGLLLAASAGAAAALEVEDHNPVDTLAETDTEAAEANVAPGGEPNAPSEEAVTNTTGPQVDRNKEKTSDADVTVTRTRKTVTKRGANTVEALSEPVRKTTRRVVEPVSKPADRAVDTVTKGAEPVTERVSEITRPVVDAADRTTEPVRRAVTDTAGPVTERLEPVVREVEQTAEPVTRVIEPVTPIVEPVAPVIDRARPIVDPVIDPLDPVIGPVAPVIDPVLPRPQPEPVNPDILRPGLGPPVDDGETGSISAAAASVARGSAAAPGATVGEQLEPAFADTVVRPDAVEAAHASDSGFARANGGIITTQNEHSSAAGSPSHAPSPSDGVPGSVGFAGALVLWVALLALGALGAGLRAGRGLGDSIFLPRGLAPLPAVPPG